FAGCESGTIAPGCASGATSVAEPMVPHACRSLRFTSALATLAVRVRNRPEVDALGAEIARLEVSYG
ncbi:MAG: hypothetical protein K8M05_21440, partial [Deltaproteobacteria bacterium]|nr:hypothetical protein [Kofleriaceae bacterium]